jgi:hypothetical protein
MNDMVLWLYNTIQRNASHQSGGVGGRIDLPRSLIRGQSAPQNFQVDRGPDPFGYPLGESSNESHFVLGLIAVLPC